MGENVVTTVGGGGKVSRFAEPIFRCKGWMRFLGVMSILNGIVQALSCIGILWAWLPLWQGVLLFQSAGAIEEASAHDNEERLVYSLDRLRLFIVITGVVTLITLLVSIISVVFTLTFLFGMLGIGAAAAASG